METEPKIKRPRGRPKLPPQVRRRHNMTFRVRDGLLQSLIARAAANQRSTSEEIEYIIENALYMEDVAERMITIVRQEIRGAL